MIAITLPDGSVRSFDHPVTVAEVAASIGAGLAKAALAGRAGGKGGSVEEDLLAVIRRDEAEALLVVVELDLAGGHCILPSRWLP